MLFLLTIFEGLAARLAGRPTARLSGLHTLFLFRSFIFSFVGSDPDPSLFWCNNETAVSGQSLESCKNNMTYNDVFTVLALGPGFRPIFIHS